MDRSKPENHARSLKLISWLGKKQLGKIIDKCIKVHGTAITSEVLDEIKAQGYKYSTIGAITVAVCDATIPPAEKAVSWQKRKLQIDEISSEFNDGPVVRRRTL